MKKFALVLIGARKGGLERRILRLCEYLQNQESSKDQFILFCSSPILNLAREEKIVDIRFPYIEIPMIGNKISLKHIFLVLKKLWQNRNQFESVAVFGASIKLAWLLPPNKRICSFIVNREPFLKRQRHFLFRYFVLFGLKRSHSIDALTPENKRYLVQECPKLENKISVSPCSFIHHEPEVPFSKKEKLITWAGHFVPTNQPELFLQTISECKNVIEESNYQVSMYGFGDLEPLVRKKISQLHLEKMVHVSYVSPLTNALKSSCIHIMTAETNNYGTQVLFEALSNGCIILATDVGDTNLLVDEKNGLLSKSDPSSLAKNLVYLMNLPKEKLSQMSKISRKKAEKHNIDDYSSHFLKVLNGKKFT